jgi:hypothetical protein
MLQQVLKLREKTLGTEHLDTLGTMQNLALVVEAQRKHDTNEPSHPPECQHRSRS